MGTGAFSEATMLTTKALRLYAERGLLSPAHVDPTTGYRYYEPEQTRTGRLIGLMRAADVPLTDVEAVVDASPDQAAARVVALKARLRSRSADAEALLDAVAARLGTLVAVTDGASVDWVGSTPVLSVSSHVAVDALDAHAERSLERLRHAADQAGVMAVADPICVFHGPVNVEADGPVEVLLPVNTLAPVPDGVRALRTHGGWFAHLPARGSATSFPQVLAAYDALATWCELRGDELAGPPRETWVRAPWEPEPELLIGWPIRRQDEK
jgi:DNA-binding transcriptional MerR regulator